MPGSDHSFAGKFLSRLRKIDPEQVESFLSQVLREKAFLEQVFDTLTDGIIVTEGTKHVVFVNDAARQLHRLDKECIGKKIDQLLREEKFLAIVEEFRETLEPIKQREVQLRNQVGKETFSVSVVPLENEEGLTTHAVWIFSDRTEAEFRQEERRQIDNLESLAALTAGVAHEVKNPLNSLNIHAQLISKAAKNLERQPSETDRERLQKSTQVVLEEITRLAHVVDGFIKAVRPVKPNFQKHNPNRLCMNIAELIGPECHDRGVDLVMDQDPEIPAILIDREQIQQAILNIVKNASEAVEPHTGQIDIRTRLKSDHVLIEVADNGPGIPEEERLRIFEPYHTTKFSGTGLGLMMVYRIIRAHRGALGLHSEVGVGTVFSMALPLDERPVKLLEAQVDPPLE